MQNTQRVVMIRDKPSIDLREAKRQLRDELFSIEF